MRHAKLFSLSDRLMRLLVYGDSFEELGRIIDFETNRPATPVSALAYRAGVMGCRPPYDLLAMCERSI